MIDSHLHELRQQAASKAVVVYGGRQGPGHVWVGHGGQLVHVVQPRQEVDDVPLAGEVVLVVAPLCHVVKSGDAAG